MGTSVEYSVSNAVTGWRLYGRESVAQMVGVDRYGRFNSRPHYQFTRVVNQALGLETM